MPALAEFSIGALSRQSGVHIETIRYYEKIGVMPTPARSPGGYRIYAPEHLQRLSFVRRGRELGFSLGELRRLLCLVDGHSYTCAEVRTLTFEHVAEVRRKIADLRRLAKVMAEMAARCSGERVPECPVIEVLFDGRPAGDPRRAAADHRKPSAPRRARKV